MSPHGELQSIDGQKPASSGDEADLNQLARQTLAGVKPNILPPEPFAAGFDLSALAASSRTSRPPAGACVGEDETGGRIDLRAATQTPAPRAESTAPPRTLPPLKRQGPRAVAGSSEPAESTRPLPAIAAPVLSSTGGTAPALRGGASSPRAHELDALIEARAFAPGSQLGARAAQVFSALQRAPAWSWAVAAAVAIGIAFAASDSDADAEQTPSTAASFTSAASAAPATPSLPLAATALPQAIAAPRASASSPGMRTAVALQRARGAGPALAGAPQATAATSSTRAPIDPATAQERTLDTLLDQAIGTGVTVTAPAPPVTRARSGPALPQLPAREAVSGVMSGLLPRIRFCAGERSGIATAHVIVSRDGRVSSARISGAPYSRTAAGRCMETVIRGARFPAFEQATFRMTYPFQL